MAQEKEGFVIEFTWNQRALDSTSSGAHLIHERKPSSHMARYYRKQDIERDENLLLPVRVGVITMEFPRTSMKDARCRQTPSPQVVTMAFDSSRHSQITTASIRWIDTHTA
jgi:hypothetical protein